MDAKPAPRDDSDPKIIAVDLGGKKLSNVVVPHSRSPEAMDIAAVEFVARRIMLHLYRGSIELARASLEDAWESHLRERAPLPTGRDLREEPLARVIDDVRLLNFLEFHHIETVGDLLDMKQTVSIPNIGIIQLRQLHELRSSLRKRAKSDPEEMVV